MFAVGVLTTSMLDVNSAGSISKRNWRPFAPPFSIRSFSATVLPLSSVLWNCGPSPRTLTYSPSPRGRVIVTPGIICSASATFCVGNLPMSVELIESTP